MSVNLDTKALPQTTYPIETENKKKEAFNKNNRVFGALVAVSATSITGLASLLQASLSEETKQYISNHRPFSNTLSAIALLYGIKGSSNFLSKSILGEDTADQRTLNHEKAKKEESLYEYFKHEAKVIFGTTPLIDRIAPSILAIPYLAITAISAGILLLPKHSDKLFS